MKATKAKTHKQTNITMRFPVDLLEALKKAAPQRGFCGYQPLVKYYISEGMRRDQEEHHRRQVHHFIDALRSQGIPEEVLTEAVQRMAVECHPPAAVAEKDEDPPREPSSTTRRETLVSPETRRHRREQRADGGKGGPVMPRRQRPRGSAARPVQGAGDQTFAGCAAIDRVADETDKVAAGVKARLG